MELRWEFKRALAPLRSKPLQDVQNWEKCSPCYNREKFYVLYGRPPYMDGPITYASSPCFVNQRALTWSMYSKQIFPGYSMMSILLNFARHLVFWSTMEPMPFRIPIEIPRLEYFIDFFNFLYHAFQKKVPLAQTHTALFLQICFTGTLFK